MLQQFPVEIPKKILTKIKPNELLRTRQRVIDTFFPIIKGETACIAGPFGSGKLFPYKN